MSDEVFSPYSFHPTSCLSMAPEDSAQEEAGPITFVLDGLSKRCGLPHLKLAWTTVYGPRAFRGHVVERFAWIADNYLSVATPVQHALDDVLRQGEAIQAQIQQRVLSNRHTLIKAFETLAEVDVLNADGGWYAVLRLPNIQDDETWALRLAHKHGVIVQPGFFYDFPIDAHIVLSLLPPPDMFTEGIARLRTGICQALVA